MKKNYFMLVCLMLFMALQATAQNFTIDQLYGKWQFTADVEFTADATQAHKETLSGDCEAVISADETYIARIVGFAGSTAQQNINMIGAKNGQDMVKINNLNNPQLWNSLFLANENGENPYGYWENGAEVVKSYGPVYYNVYVADGLITIPDFTVVTLPNGFGGRETVVIAKYTNVKMTLIEAETIQVPDISGSYQFKAGAGTYDTMAGSVIPTEFAVNLDKTQDDNKSYDATIAIEGYDNVVLPATYNGVSVVLDYDNTYLDEVNGIRFAPMYGSATDGSIEFKAQSETAFSLYGGFSFASDTIVKAAEGVTDSLVVNGNYHQWYTAGSLKMATDAPAFDWAGVYNVKAGDLYVANAAGIEWPTEFQFEVEYNESSNDYSVTSVFGYDIYNINYGGLSFTPSEDGKSVEISTGYLATIEPGVSYMKILDLNLTSSPIEMTVNEDGTMSIMGLSVATGAYGSDDNTLNAYYSSLVVTKEASEGDAEAFDWLGTWEVTSGYQVSYDGKEYPTSFYMTIEESNGLVLVTQFMSNDVTGLNYGGITFTIAADNKSAEMETDAFVGGSYPNYLKVYDMNGSTGPVVFTANEDGTISIDDFFLANYDYNTYSITGGAVFYQQVVATKCSTGIENVVVENNAVEGIYDIQGRKIEQITAPGLYIVNGKKVIVK